MAVYASPNCISPVAHLHSTNKVRGHLPPSPAPPHHSSIPVILPGSSWCANYSPHRAARNTRPQHPKKHFPLRPCLAVRKKAVVRSHGSLLHVPARRVSAQYNGYALWKQSLSTVWPGGMMRRFWSCVPSLPPPLPPWLTCWLELQLVALFLLVFNHH